ncbi:MAG: helix-turn-helix domain-containing protein [Erythrobacter sp.]|jgi:hypothetical protein|nr:helix-turn-helix domain-containing protein [Erythrobacter sp.]
MSAHEIIERLKARFDVTTDQELARKLDLGRSTIASWRSRDSVPRRYAEAADGAPWARFHFAYNDWTEIEQRAFELAIVHLVRTWGCIATDYRAFLKHGGWAAKMLWFYHSQASSALAEAVDEHENRRGDSSPSVANVAHLLAYDLFFSETPTESVFRELGTAPYADDEG